MPRQRQTAIPTIRRTPLRHTSLSHWPTASPPPCSPPRPPSCALTSPSNAPFSTPTAPPPNPPIFPAAFSHTNVRNHQYHIQWSIPSGGPMGCSPQSATLTAPIKVSCKKPPLEERCLKGEWCRCQSVRSKGSSRALSCMKSERLYKKEGDQWSPLRRADVVTYGVIGAKGVPYEVNGKSRCAVKCGV